MTQQIGLFGNVNAPLSIPWLIGSLAIGLLLALILRWHYIKFGASLTNRQEFANTFPFILLTTVLIISVVKSSLALSLGLVGALSIVRFRTPIKEPEELAYLFLAIAIGLGLGANQTVPTILASLAILACVALLRWTQRDKAKSNLFLSIEWPFGSELKADGHLEDLNLAISKHALTSDLRRFDLRPDGVAATYALEVSDASALNALADDLRAKFHNINVTFLDQNRLADV